MDRKQFAETVAAAVMGQWVRRDHRVMGNAAVYCNIETGRFGWGSDVNPAVDGTVRVLVVEDGFGLAQGCTYDDVTKSDIIGWMMEDDETCREVEEIIANAVE